MSSWACAVVRGRGPGIVMWVMSVLGARVHWSLEKGHVKRLHRGDGFYLPRMSIIGQVMREGTRWKGESIGTTLTKAGGLEKGPRHLAGRQ